MQEITIIKIKSTSNAKYSVKLKRMLHDKTLMEKLHGVGKSALSKNC